MTKANEELADLRISVAQLATEVTCLKGNSRAANSAEAEANENDQTGVKTTSSNATASGQSPVVVDVQLEVHKTFRDMAKRKLNVIVAGLPEANCSDLDEMKAADTLPFMHLCEEHLSVKPVIAHRDCVRLGRPDNRRPRRLLVHLTSESSASSVLAAAKQLRRSDDAYMSEHVFVNPDLSPAEAKLAFEQRQRRRTAKTARRSQPQSQPAPQHSSTPADSSVIANYASQSAMERSRCSCCRC